MTLRTSTADGVKELTLDRQESGNAFDADHYDALAGALESAADDRTRCVVLGAAGRLFCAGADLGDLADGLGGAETPARRAYDRMLKALETFSKPLVAAVGGPAVGIGFTLLGHADVVLVSDQARFRAPFARLGLVPEAGSTATLPAGLGPQTAAHLLLTGDWLSADGAVEAGLALRKVPAAELRETALELARKIARHPLDSLVATKRLLAEARPADPAEARRREDAAFVAALGRAETAGLVREALKAL